MFFQKSLLALLLSLIPFLGMAQNQKAVCGTDEYYEDKIQENPQLKKIEKRVNQKLKSQQFLDKRPSGEKMIIPVVYHIIHDGGEYNLSKERILDNLERINKDFQQLNQDTSRVRSVFQNRIANMNIEFRLAQVGPNGQCTNGINREKSSLTTRANDNVKRLVQWDPDMYLNIWSVGSISRSGGGRVAGYANFPWMDEDDDGIVIQADNIDGEERTLTHEIGHYLGLFHPFQGGCSDNDRVDDTPPMEQTNFRCNSKNTCTDTTNDAGRDFPDMIENYMDYTTCGTMFSDGQKERVEGFLPPSNTRFARTNLVSQNNLIQTGVKDLTRSPEIAEVEVEKRYVFPCEQIKLDYKLSCSNNNGLQSGTPENINWEVPNANLSNPNSESPKASFNQPGTYSVKLTLSNQQGSDQLEKEQLITVFDDQKKVTQSYFQNFEDSNLAKDGIVIEPNTQGNQWRLNEESAFRGDASLFLNNHDLEADQEVVFRLPKMDLANNSNPVLVFDLAYAQKTSNSQDILEIETSPNCGTSWISRKRFIASFNLPSRDPISQPFYPENKDEWDTRTVKLPQRDGLMVRFAWEAIDPGNNVFIDNIRMNYNVGRESQKALDRKIEVFPNPVQKGDALTITQQSLKGDVSMTVTDVAGKELWQNQQVNPGSNKTKRLSLNQMNINSEGVYYITFAQKDQTITRKIVVIE